MSAIELVALVCCDLGAIVRGRALPARELDAHRDAGVSWVPANLALTPLGGLAEPNPFGSTGDLRLLPDLGTRVRVPGGAGASALELVLCDIVQTDASPWEACPRRFLRDALAELEQDHGLTLVASFEHELQLLDDPGVPGARLLDGEDAPSLDPSAGATRVAYGTAERAAARATPRNGGRAPGLPFSLDALRRAEPFASEAMAALAAAGLAPERVFAEYAPRQLEIPVQAAHGLAAADRAVLFREIVREVARRRGLRATLTPLLDPAEAGNGVHVHLTLLDRSGRPALYDASRPACLSRLGTRFAAGILRHARALTALTAPSPVSATRMGPHRWSAGAVTLGQRNRETLLRLPPLVTLGGGDPAFQLRLEYRGADAAANPHLALGAIVRAGLHGLRSKLPTPPILDRDPASLDKTEAQRHGVGALPLSLEESLDALARDQPARAWLAPLLYEALMAVKRAEVEAAAGCDIQQLCRRYARVY